MENMDLKKVIDFVDSAIRNDYKYDSQHLREFNREELVETFSILLLRVEAREKELRKVVDALEGWVHDRTKELEAKNRILEELATHDELTKIYNRRYFDEKLREYSLLTERFGQTLSCIMVDLDLFKKLNDTYGHQAGDLVLYNVAQHLRNTLRRTDVCARYGGEEFVILLPDTSLKNTLKIAEKLRGVMESVEHLYDGKVLRITASFGAASGEKTVDLNEALVKRADDALYRAKQGGRNRVCK
jgi:diguanylate cyclase (GGDEF)-like protein